jgi:hypothetical protein
MRPIQAFVDELSPRTNAGPPSTRRFACRVSQPTNAENAVNCGNFGMHPAPVLLGRQMVVTPPVPCNPNPSEATTAPCDIVRSRKAESASRVFPLVFRRYSPEVLALPTPMPISNETGHSDWALVRVETRTPNNASNAADIFIRRAWRGVPPGSPRRAFFNQGGIVMVARETNQGRGVNRTFTRVFPFALQESGGTYTPAVSH